MTHKITVVRAIHSLQAVVDSPNSGYWAHSPAVRTVIDRISDLEEIRSAAEKLVRSKGRYHSGQNYRALAALFGVTTPDLPPLCGESDDVTVKLPALCMGVVQMGHAVMVSDDAGHWFNKTAILEMLTAAGIKWDSD